MKRTVFEIVAIITVSCLVAIIYNNVSNNSLPLFKKNDKNIDKSLKQTNIYFQEVEAEYVKQLVDNHEAILIDARLSSIYKKGHIPGSISLPVSKFEDMFPGFESRLKSDQIIVTYCIGISCEDSFILAMKLHKKGVNSIMIYKGGMEDWMEKGYYIEK